MPDPETFPHPISPQIPLCSPANTEVLFRVRCARTTTKHMQNEQRLNQTNREETVTPDRNMSSSPDSFQTCERSQKLRMRIRVPRRSTCLTRQAMLAALREAELADWQNNGGDFLTSTLTKRN